jgi:tetratricopeptide (TPR) repeat protein
MDFWIEIAKIVAWPIALFLFLGFFVLVFKKSIGKMLERGSVRVKKGDTEVEVKPEIEETKTRLEAVKSEEITASLLPPGSDNKAITAVEPKTADDLFFEMFNELQFGDVDAGKNAFEQLQAIEKDSVKKRRNEAYFHFFLFQRGDTSALSSLERLALQSDIAGIVHSLLGQCHDTAGNHEKAVNEFELAANSSSDQVEHARFAVQAAKSLFKAGKHLEAPTRLMVEIGKASEAEVFAILYSGLADVYELAKDAELRALTLEKALEYRPNDVQLRFQAGYAYAEKTTYLLSLLHYKTLLKFSPDYTAAFNNMGVAYTHLDLPIFAVEAFKKSAEKGETLATSNLASKLIDAGFAEDASQMLEKAQLEKDANPRVNEALSTLAIRRKNETEKENSIVESAQAQQRFHLAFAEAYFKQVNNAFDVAGSWVSSDGMQIDVTQNGGDVVGVWSDKGKRLKFSGRICNRAVLATFYTEQYSLATKSREFSESGQAKIYFASDKQRMFMLNLEGNSQKYVTLERINNPVLN